MHRVLAAGHATQQVAVPCSHVVAVTIPIEGCAAVIVFAYDVGSTDGQAANEEQLRAKLQIIRDAYHSVKSDAKRNEVDLLLCADLNRHHVLRRKEKQRGTIGHREHLVWYPSQSLFRRSSYRVLRLALMTDSYQHPTSPYEL